MISAFVFVCIVYFRVLEIGSPVLSFGRNLLPHAVSHLFFFILLAWLRLERVWYSVVPQTEADNTEKREIKVNILFCPSSRSVQYHNIRSQWSTSDGKGGKRRRKKELWEKVRQLH
ncbi:hypothetical protein, unlikely [Trypanosoma brucei brucei TREU927]|uniref:Uncharacterized protein n=1 Tax=Trypanosoma brucei brucei (strain 927/4 GUTat10.1) TaxID=185431 RepID=Q38DM3_TRYB2|nr:hypothetical protein, unlikely [Trypanosoma brucei brucei TREU927]EAN77097.1 hypothetical protein, unlikely [Trypanosoma brucei brucei TREU927]